MSQTVYIAAPLFTQAERRWNEALAIGLRLHGFHVILPQETAAAAVRPGEPLPVKRLFENAIEGIRVADVVVAVLEGSDPDSGTSFECGFAHALEKPVVGLRTDLRRGGDDPAYEVNLMLSQSATSFVLAASEDIESVTARTAAALGVIATRAVTTARR